MTPYSRTDRHQGKAEGEARKGAALDLLTARREVYVLRGRRALLTRLLMEGSATADDVRGAVKLPTELNPKLFGAVPTALVKMGIIAADGFTNSIRPEAHARPVQRWRLIDRQAATAWMHRYPNLPDPAPAEAEGTLFDLTTNTKPTVAPAGFVFKKGFSQ
jgi:hypothetical protein